MNANKNYHLFDRALPKKWALICLINLLIACTIGLLMRYKIAYAFPLANEDHLLHAHDHFVFCGWACLALFSCMVVYLLPDYFRNNPGYRIMFSLLEISAFGMLVSFLYQDYGVYSVFFSILFVVVFYWFLIRFWIDHSKCEVPVEIKWFVRVAVMCFFISSIGLYFLSYISFNGSGSGIFTRATVYFYFHFMYNGFFTFAIFALLLDWLNRIGFYHSSRKMKTVFWHLAVGVIPGYFISIIGFYSKIWIELLSLFAVVTHLIAAFILLLVIWKDYRNFGDGLHKQAAVLWKIATAAFFVKIFMQAASLVPSLAVFAFSFRPIIIGYLHLTFICFISFFLLGFMLSHNQLHTSHSKLATMGFWLFIIFGVMNEVVLFFHSFVVYFSIYVKYSYFSVMLLWVTVGIFLGLLFLVLGQIGTKKEIAEEIGNL